MKFSLVKKPTNIIAQRKPNDYINRVQSFLKGALNTSQELTTN